MEANWNSAHSNSAFAKSEFSRKNVDSEDHRLQLTIAAARIFRVTCSPNFVNRTKLTYTSYLRATAFRKRI